MFRLTKLGHAFVVVSLFALVLAVASPSGATPISAAFVVEDTDWTSGAVGGIGGGNGIGGTGSITIAGVTGPVTKAYLYWHGIDNLSLRSAATQPGPEAIAMGSVRAEGAVLPEGGGCDGVYNSPNILLNGSPVTGVSLGDATTNCWGNGSSRAFRADVTSLVAGNGVYTLSSMTTDGCDDVNGASLIVAFNDGNTANDRDLVFFEGNDSNIAAGFPGETDGWHATLNGIAYTSGSASIQLHLGDGQNFTVSGMDDNSLTLTAGGPAVVIPDGLNVYDGASTPSAGFSRSVAAGYPGSLWDVHTFDITGVFGAAGNYNLSLDGQDPFNDCTGLVLAVINLVAGQAPVPAQPTTWGKVKGTYR